MSTRLFVTALIAGACWGGLAWLLGARALGPSIWGGLVASPFVGVVVARLVHPRFQAAQGLARGFWVLSSVYLGAICFSLACGALAVIQSSPGRARLEVLFEPVVGVLWGITMTGYLLFLWPLAYATHWWLERRAE